MEKFKVTRIVEERTALDRLASVGKAAARKLAHARILHLADEGSGGPRRTDEEIVESSRSVPQPSPGSASGS